MSDQVELNLKIITILVFFLVLAFGARQRLLDTRELIWVGAALIIGSSLILYPTCAKVMIETFGYGLHAFLLAALPVLVFAGALTWSVRFMVQKMNADPNAPPPPPKPRVTKAVRRKRPEKPVVRDTSHPKPPRARGGKRRF